MLVAHAMAQASSSANTVVIDVAPAVPTGGKPDGPRAKAPAAELPAPARLPAPGATPSAAPPAAAKSAAAPAAAPATEPAEKPYRPPPAPNKKSYLPSFIAPEAYGKKKQVKSTEEARKEAAEAIAKREAKKKRERLAAKRKNRGSKAQTEVVAEEVAAWQLFFTIALGVFLAVAEALDIDVRC